MSDLRRHAPATERNREPILAVLAPELPPHGRVLEIASGTGEHVVFLAGQLPHLVFQPSDADPGAQASVNAWARHAKLDNVRPALALDVTAPTWPIDAADAVLCVNMIHISPWAATLGLMRGAARILPPGGLLFLYGPYKRGGVHTAPSNEAFDRSLQAQNPAWGVRDLETVATVATEAGFGAPRSVEMPANNLSLLFRRAATA